MENFILSKKFPTIFAFFSSIIISAVIFNNRVFEWGSFIFSLFFWFLLSILPSSTIHFFIIKFLKVANIKLRLVLMFVFQFLGTLSLTYLIFELLYRFLSSDLVIRFMSA